MSQIKINNPRWSMELELDERVLKYFFKDKSLKTEVRTQIRYEDISNDYYTKYEQINLAGIGFYFVLLFANFIVFISGKPQIGFLAFLGIGGGFMVWAIWGLSRKTKTIKLSNGDFKILEDKENGIHKL